MEITERKLIFLVTWPEREREMERVLENGVACLYMGAVTARVGRCMRTNNRVYCMICVCEGKAGIEKVMRCDAAWHKTTVKNLKSR